MNSVRYNSKNINSTILDRKSPLKYTFTRSKKSSLGKPESRLSGKFLSKGKLSNGSLNNKDNSKYAQVNSKASTKFSNSDLKKTATDVNGSAKEGKKLIILPRKQINTSKNFLRNEKSKEKSSGLRNFNKKDQSGSIKGLRQKQSTCNVNLEGE